MEVVPKSLCPLPFRYTHTHTQLRSGQRERGSPGGEGLQTWTAAPIKAKKPARGALGERQWAQAVQLLPHCRTHSHEEGGAALVYLHFGWQPPLGPRATPPPLPRPREGAPGRMGSRGLFPPNVVFIRNETAQSISGSPR